MTTLVHISDLHFGAIREETLDPLASHIENLAPAALVISGDLTQRARSSQFKAAARFLKRLPCKNILVVPGNHDIPLWNPLRRFINPRRDFFRYITPDTYPVYEDDIVSVIGIDTSRSFTVSNGRINSEQLGRIRSYFESRPASSCRVVVAHHPFVVPEEDKDARLVGRAERALSDVLEDEVDLLLTGHRHLAWVRDFGTSLLTVHCGTTTSLRTRGEQNGFHEIVIDPQWVNVRPWRWSEETDCFHRVDDEVNWRRRR